MNQEVVLPALTSILALVFALALFDQWRERRGGFQLIWTIGMEVPSEATGRYGIIASEPSEDPLDHGRLHRVTKLVEKPSPGEAPSNLAVIGRYVLTPKIFDKLEQTQHGADGEIQLTDGIAALMEEQQVFAYTFEGTRYDAGTTMGWLKASVEIALARPDLGTEFRAYLQSLQL